MHKEIYTETEIEIIRFSTQDVITTTSGGDGGDETSQLDP